MRFSQPDMMPPPRPGNTSGEVVRPVVRMMSMTTGGNGTMCSRPLLLIVAGIVQVAASGSMSAHRMAAVSVRRWPQSRSTFR